MPKCLRLVVAAVLLLLSVSTSSVLAQSIPCTVAADCSNHATSVSGNSQTGCVCTCRNMWEGAQCQDCASNYNPSKDCATCATGYAGYPECSPVTERPSPAPPSPAAAGCADVVRTYWQLMLVGNMTGALEHVSADSTFVWPGDKSVLPMAGTWNGPAGIANFFGKVSQYFNFGLSRKPVVYMLDHHTAFATWAESSTLLNSTYVPCPDLVNQAIYKCDPATHHIYSVFVNLDNSCVARAICSETAHGKLECIA